ncbi:hypothetical protein PanWU01x14_202690 [Parasponia andersonii]|uniref:RNase H type-1 domain-containing protein n=1 Tax=Parasponia andersonii TaxID=3476 RepID=A0A2P5BX67_PARAD|nr:hypothetical protein PanWU01x14_202690 [Parasponia andersonii]
MSVQIRASSDVAFKEKIDTAVVIVCNKSDQILSLSTEGFPASSPLGPELRAILLALTTCAYHNRMGTTLDNDSREAMTAIDSKTYPDGSLPHLLADILDLDSFVDFSVFWVPRELVKATHDLASWAFRSGRSGNIILWEVLPLWQSL